MKKSTFKNKNFITVIILVALSMAVLFVLTRPKKEVKWAVTPHVVVNNEIYSYGFSNLCYEEGKLPEDYIEIGHVKSTVSASENAPNWGSNACDAGDIIYKSPNNPNEILVYTNLFAGDKYHYLGFVRKYPEYIEVIEAPLPLEAVQSMSDTVVYDEIVEAPVGYELSVSTGNAALDEQRKKHGISDSFKFFVYNLSVIKDSEGVFKEGDVLSLVANTEHREAYPELGVGMKIVVPVGERKQQTGRYDYSVDGMYYVTPEEYVISVIDEEKGIKDMNMNGVKVDTLLKFFKK